MIKHKEEILNFVFNGLLGLFLFIFVPFICSSIYSTLNEAHACRLTDLPNQSGMHNDNMTNCKHTKN